MERERDEAREELADWQDSAKNVRKEYEDEQHCSCVPILRKLLKDVERERDEARVERDSLQALSQSLAETCVKLKAERDEARAERERHGWRLTS
jgi:chromosome segregation ATPase